MILFLVLVNAAFQAGAKARYGLISVLNVGPFVIHDIRIFVATHMSQIGIPPFHVEAVLNHVSGTSSVAKIYNRNTFEGEKAQALTRWARTPRCAHRRAQKQRHTFEAGMRTMQASDDIEDNWEQLLRELGKAAQHRLVSDKHGRSAAIIQLRAILTFLDQTAASGLIIPLRILCGALQDLDSGAKPDKILTPRKPERRQRDDLTLWTVKVELQ